MSYTTSCCLQALTRHSNVSCCANDDFCLEDGLCRYTNSRVGGSGYYVAGCTDQQYLDGSCPQLCNALSVKDVVFVQQPSQLWKCCGAAADGTAQCDQPTDENFDAPRPQRIDTYYQAGVGPVTATDTSSTTSTSAATTTASLILPPPPPPPKSTGISAGVAGGIAAGAAVVILIISLIFVYFLRRRSPRRIKDISGPLPAENGGYDFKDMRNAGPETPRRGLTSYDSGDNRSLVHAVTLPWPLQVQEDKKEEAVVGVVEEMPREELPSPGHHEAWEMPAEDVRPKTPQR